MPKSIYLVAGLAAALFLLAVAPTAFSQEPPHEPRAMGTPESWLILPELPERRRRPTLARRSTGSSASPAMATGVKG